MSIQIRFDDPIELDNGRTLVCRRHMMVVCFRCCVDYSFMQDNEYSSDDDDSRIPSLIPLQGQVQISASNDTFFAPQNRDTNPLKIFPEARRGTGRVRATEFVSPETLFVGRSTCSKITRYVDRTDAGRALIFTDGACLNNGRQDPRAGWGFVHGPRATNDPPEVGDARTVSGRLENTGPYGGAGMQTSNRAELRAVTGALDFRYWPGEGFHTIVIATDSTYVVNGTTKWVNAWVRNGWKTQNGEEVKNKDLWEFLLGRMETLAESSSGLFGHLDEPFKIQFWKIPREWNGIADAAAKQGAQEPEIEQEIRVRGIAI